jgi:hypothetical protein
MTTDAAKGPAAPDTRAPTAVDERDRSAQTFTVDVGSTAWEASGPILGPWVLTEG